MDMAKDGAPSSDRPVNSLTDLPGVIIIDYYTCLRWIKQRPYYSNLHNLREICHVTQLLKRRKFITET
jgi:hypothetical protein